MNAIAAGAIGVVLVGTGQAPLNLGNLATAQANTPVLGAGDMHGDELKKALCTGINPDATPAPTACADQKTVTLRLATNNYSNHPRPWSSAAARRSATRGHEGPDRHGRRAHRLRARRPWRP